MYDENEVIKIKWTTRNKKYYEERGYLYTGMGSELNIKLGDLP